MRLTCDVDISNRLLPSFNMKGKKRSVRTQLSIGRKPGSEKDGKVFLMMCTKQDRNGVKCELKDNVEQIFARFIEEGKATVRMTQPPNDICLSKADPVQLKGFLSVLRMCSQGKPIDKVTLSALAPASAKQVEKPKTRMSILSRKDYPLTTGFPNSLEFLQVTGCKLKRFDTRILELRCLKVLDLSGNSLTSVPEEMSKMQSLSELKLSHNNISELPRTFCCSHLSGTLRLLDLSSNKLKYLKPYFCELVSVTRLNLEENELVCLPFGISKLCNLRFLNASQNKLKVLPAGFGMLNLEELDLFGNEFIEDGPSTAKSRLHFPELLEFAARAISSYRINYSDENECIPGQLVDYLNSGKQCLCGKPCFRSFVHYLARLDLGKVAHTVTSLDQVGRTHAPAEAFLCSQRCYERYQANPYSAVLR